MFKALSKLLQERLQVKEVLFRTKPTHMQGAPKPISGPEIQPTTIAQQQAVFTSPYQPQAPIIDPTWQPTSAYDMNADVLADSRTQWSKPIIDRIAETRGLAGWEWALVLQ